MSIAALVISLCALTMSALTLVVLWCILRYFLPLQSCVNTVETCESVPVVDDTEPESIATEKYEVIGWSEDQELEIERRRKAQGTWREEDI